MCLCSIIVALLDSSRSDSRCFIPLLYIAQDLPSVISHGTHITRFVLIARSFNELTIEAAVNTRSLLWYGNSRDEHTYLRSVLQQTPPSLLQIIRSSLH